MRVSDILQALRSQGLEEQRVHSLDLEGILVLLLLLWWLGQRLRKWNLLFKSRHRLVFEHFGVEPLYLITLFVKSNIDIWTSVSLIDLLFCI